MKQTIIYDLLIFILVLILLIFLKPSFLSIFLTFFLVLIYCHKKKGINTELGFSKPKNLIRTITYSFLLAIGIVLLSYFILLPQIQTITGYQLDLGMFKQLKGNTNLLILSIVLGWVVGGLIEETIFRGFIVSTFISHLPARIGAIIGVVISSIIFGYLHNYQGVTGQILTGLIGLMLAVIFIINKICYENKN